MTPQVLSIACVLCAGCAVELEEPEVSENSSEISIAGGVSWGTPGQEATPLELGSTYDMTCFLRGASGDFEGDVLKTHPYWSEVNVYPSQDKWWVRTHAGHGTGVMAHVVCVNVPFGPSGGQNYSSKVFHWEDNVSNAGLPAPANRRCFLSQIWNGEGLNSANARIVLKKTGLRWTMNESVVDGAGSFRGGATAVCIDAPITAEWTFTFTGPSPGISTTTLRNSYPNGTPVPTSNVACGMTGIRGNWLNAADINFGWNDGVVAHGDSSAWRVTATSGKQASFTCIK